MCPRASEYMKPGIYVCVDMGEREEEEEREGEGEEEEEEGRGGEGGGGGRRGRRRRGRGRERKRRGGRENLLGSSEIEGVKVKGSGAWMGHVR